MRRRPINCAGRCGATGSATPSSRWISCASIGPQSGVDANRCGPSMPSTSRRRTGYRGRWCTPRSIRRRFPPHWGWALRSYPADSAARLLTMTLLLNETGMEIHKVVVGPFENNVYVLRCAETGEAVLLDAANEHEQLLELAQRLGVRRVLETHGHDDHIQAVPAMREAGYEVA